VFLLSNYIHNKIEQVRRRNTFKYIYIYIHTRVPPLVEADRIGLVTGEIGPVPIDDFFPFVAAPVATIAASKN
jgi:hypothetical protein